MGVLGLGYVGIGAADAAAWRPFATGLLGMEEVEAGGGAAAYRVDESGRRLIVAPAARDGGAFYGWEVAGPDELDALAAALEDRGAAVAGSTEAERALRGVAGMVHCADPDGRRAELFHGLDPAGGGFAPGRPMSGFRSGALGLGHIAVHAGDPAGCAAFYRDALGFRVTDWREAPTEARFLRCNARHHAIAVFGGAAPKLNHAMVELDALDDVGEAYDMALAEDGRVALTLGRHSNDRVISFYMNTPSGFMLEYGWGGRLVADSARTEKGDIRSLWGHRRHRPATAAAFAIGGRAE